MRISLTLLLICFVVFVSAQTKDPAPSADAVLQPVLAKAKAENKKVLLIFHASWCGWCRKMDASLNDKVVKPLIDKNFEVAHLTVYESQNKKHLENSGAQAFLEKHGGAEKGLPYWYILNGDGSVLLNSEMAPDKNSGCPASEKEVAYFITVLKKTTGLTADELETVRKRFRQNEL
ncbi:thioredoxin family protein [Flavisolibacter sp. BT320]|nr:thioredoxin family protein [Flavisolibacter longurius]